MVVLIDLLTCCLNPLAIYSNCLLTDCNLYCANTMFIQVCVECIHYMAINVIALQLRGHINVSSCSNNLYRLLQSSHIKFITY